MAKKFTSIESIRRENVRNLMLQNKTTRTELSQGAKINYALLGHYIGKNPTKAIGEETANKIEAYFGKSHNWLDHEHHQDDLVSIIATVNSSLEEEPSYLIKIPVHKKFIYREVENTLSFEEVYDICYFHTDFFKTKCINPDDFRLINALDNSMKPYIVKSDKVGIDINEVDIKDGEIYAILLDRKHMMLKQVFIESKDILRLHSLNSDYPDRLVSFNNDSNILVVGKQVYRAG